MTIGGGETIGWDYGSVFESLSVSDLKANYLQSNYLQSNYLQSSTSGNAATYSLNLQLIDTRI